MNHSSASEPRRVLVVDDHEDCLQTLVELLRVNGYEVIAARNGLEAVAAAREHRPCAVLLDLGMPVMDGFDAARAMRMEPELKDVFIAALTGWGRPQDRTRAEDAGVDLHMLKPVDPDAVLRLLAERSGPANPAKLH